MTKAQHIYLLFFGLPLHASHHIEIPSPLSLQEQTQYIKNMLNTNGIRTADMLVACQDLPAVHNYDTMRPVLEERRDLLLRGRVSPKPPIIFAIETNNVYLLRAILDVACPKKVKNWRCSQAPAYAAVIHNATDMLREILFPTQPLESLIQHLNIAHIPEVITQYCGNRTKPTIVDNPSPSGSLFEIALEHNNHEILRLLERYLTTHYQQANTEQKQRIIHWLAHRKNVMEHDTKPTYCPGVSFCALSCALFGIGTWLAIQQKNFPDNDHSETHSFGIIVSFWAATGLLSAAMCSLHKRCCRGGEYTRKQQTAYNIYEHLLHHLTLECTHDTP